MDEIADECADIIDNVLERKGITLSPMEIDEVRDIIQTILEDGGY